MNRTMKKHNVQFDIKLGTAQYDALVDALDQYCANQGEFEACENEEGGTPDAPPSAKLAAAQEMLGQLNYLVQRLAG